MTNRRRTATAIQILNKNLERVALTEIKKDDEPKKADLKGSGVKEVKPKTSIGVPKKKKAELINTRVLLTK